MATSPDQQDSQSGAATAVAEQPTIESLRASVRGQVVLPGDDGYDEARTIYNAMIDRKPAYIVRCAGTADVMRALRFGSAHGLPVAVRGGGHGVAGLAICDGGLVIDLSRMRAVRVDPEKRTVRAEGGATWRDVDHETQNFGLATTGGMVSETGIGGLTLGGGVGWLMRKYGLACDNLLSADVVTADGHLVTASATKNKDLFWALRGGGGNFGVVTSFEYQLHPVSMVIGGLMLFPVERAAEVLRAHRAVAEQAPDELDTLVAFLDAPPAPFLPAELHGVPMVAVAGAFLGTPEQAEVELRPYRALGPVADIFGPMPYGVLQTMLDESAPAGTQNYWKAVNLRALDDEAIAALVAHNDGRPGPFSTLQILPVGGAVGRVRPEDSAFPHRQVPFIVHIVGIWPDPADNARGMAWARDAWTALQPYASAGAYLNFTNDDAQDAVRASYGDNYTRLAGIKAKYDPTNLFRANQNIVPATPPAGPLP